MKRNGLAKKIITRSQNRISNWSNEKAGEASVFYEREGKVAGKD
jgi:hypothetical protein